MRKKVLCWRWRANPLKRRSDAFESWTLLACIALMASVGPLTGIAAAYLVEESVRHQGRDLTRTTGVLVKDAPSEVVAPFTGSGGGHVRALVRWRTQQDILRTGAARVPTGTEAGERTPVWLDRNGDAQHEPTTSGDARAQGAAAGAAAATGICVVLAGGCWAVRHRLDRRRLARWEKQWAEVGPKWQQRTG